MSLRILQRRRARQDILEIIAYIAERNPQAAELVFAAYERSLTSLARSPQIGWLYPTDNPRLSGLRAFPIGRFRSYLIFYRHTADSLDVIRVLHGRRDLASLLRQEERHLHHSGLCKSRRGDPVQPSSVWTRSKTRLTRCAKNPARLEPVPERSSDVA